MSEAHDAGDDELRALFEAAKALLAWEDELGSIGLPEAVLAARAPVDDVHDDARQDGREGVSVPRAGENATVPDLAARGAARAETARAETARAETARAETGERGRSAERGDAVPSAPSVVEPASTRASDDRLESASAPRAALAPSEIVRRLDVLARDAAACTACGLHEGRTRSVFSRGAPTAEVAFVGEGPGYHEDQSGQPFVGAAGQLLDKMIAAMGLGPSEIYVCNVVKCRPPENRTPKPEEASACSPFLRGQLELVAPKVIVALGRSASEGLGCIEPGARGWRGAWTTWNGIPVMSTFHPAYLLRSPEQKRPVWDDLRAVVAKLGRSLPSRR